ncbi:rhodanese-like domain-containing protein [Echinicola salinicaeni]|uniref:rhodanese-like domain-containing protein n=1 Tax=Echinicola salinicaeni TaxID=2762757 RepID=UPI001648F58C|nr:rhodanese-like domain-containing protein [Echinicola salinicaeni]
MKSLIPQLKKINHPALYLVLLPVLLVLIIAAQQKEPWTAQQMMPPTELVKKLQLPDAKQPIIISIGPQAVIKNSIDIGPGENKDNLKDLKTRLADVPKNAEIVIYCGCCPLTKCPNARPAFTLLNDMGFKNHKLLALLTNIKVDWIDKNYPLEK